MRELRLLRAALTGVLALVAGCSMIPTYERPPAPVPATYPLETTPAQGLAGLAAADVDWQRFFADPRLKRLIELSLASNRDLRVAVLNIEQARALYDVRRADQLPTVNLQAQASRAPNSTSFWVRLDSTGHTTSLNHSSVGRSSATPRSATIGA